MVLGWYAFQWLEDAAVLEDYGGRFILVMGAGVSFLKSPYMKTTGVSLLLHGVLIALLALVGPFHTVEPSAEPAVVEVDIESAKLLDIGDMAAMGASVETAAAASAEARTAMPAEAKTAVPAEAETAMPAEAQLPGDSVAAISPAAASPGSGGGNNLGIAGTPVGGSGANPSASGGGNASSSCLYAPKPSYPPAARAAGLEGAVVVHCIIDETGSAVTVSVLKSCGYAALDEAARQGVKKWRFSPAKRNGSPIASFYDVRVVFRLIDT
jgi:periplasmic protein TonB